MKLWPTTRRDGTRWRLGAWALSLLFLVSLAQPGHAQQERGRKLDRHLRDAVEKVERGEEADAPIKVIVTMRPDAKKNLGQKVRARGGRQRGEFAVINGGAAELSPSKLQELENDDDVASISVDADVTADGVASTVTGSALNSAYSLRTTLGLPAPVTVVQTTTATAVATRSKTVSHTTGTGQNRLMLVAVSLFDGTGTLQVSSVTYAGRVLSSVPVLRAIHNQVRTELWVLVDPPSGTASAAVTLNRNSDAFVVSVSTFTGVDQAAPLGIAGALQGVSSAPNVTVTAAARQLVFGAVAVKDAVSVTTPSSQTSLWSAADASTKLRGVGGTRAGAATVTMSWQAGTTKEWDAVAVAIRPASAATSTLTGAGVTVAVIDSGLLEDGGGTSRIKTTRDFTTGLTNPPHIAPVDGYGHGTHIAGLIGGNKTEVEGVAPAVTFVSLKVLNNLGVGSTSAVINAIQWAIANKTAYGIDIINLSLGHPIFEKAATDPLVQAVESAVRHGITVVVAAGNMGINPATGQVGYTGIASPANAPSAITVGASRTLNTTSRQDDLVSDFSSRGPTWFDAYEKPDLVAPGQYVLGPAVTSQTLYTLFPTLRGPSYGGRAYLHMSGTSMAAGVVSGSVALMIEQARASFAGARPTSNALKAMLQRAAIPLAKVTGERYDRLSQGAGALNTSGAIQMAAALNPNAAANANWVSNAIPNTTTIDGQVLGWNDNVVWGTTVLYGGTLDTKLNAWNDNVVWGTNDNVVWGTSVSSYAIEDNVVWGTSATWTDNVVWGTGDNVVWGTSDDNVVWGTRANVVWGTGDNVVWGTTATSISVP